MGKGIIARTMADLLAQAKDPTEAARIQRAIDAGRNQILYHGTHTDFPAVDPSKVDLGLHLGTSEQATNRLTDLAKAKRGTNRYNDGAQIMPAAVRLGNSLEMRDVGGWGDVGQLGLVLREHPELQARQSEIDELLDSADYLRSQFVAANRHMDDPSAAWVLSDDNKQILSDMRDLLTSDGYDSIKYHNEVENTDGVRGGLLEEYQQEAADIDARMREIKQAAIQRRPPPPDMNDPNLEASMQEFLARSPVLENYMTPEEKDLIQKYGSRHHDLRMNEQYRNDPYSYIVLKPENLRSINAQFDPEFDLSPDLMKAEGGLVELARKYNKGGLIQKYQKGNLVRQWLKGYPEKSLAPLKRADVEKPEVAALNNWIDTSLAKYIKRDYGSPNDPLALLAPEQRHVPLLDEGRMRDSQTNAVWPPRRPTGDIGLSGVSSDTLDWLTNPSGRPKAYIDKVMAENPWLASLPKETILYGDVRIHDLGLQRLRDGLHNAMRPDSDLPDMLRLKPESLPRVSVAQASQLVGKINAWRAAESAKAELAASMNPATFIHKEYPEKNMRWVEIKPKDKLTKLPEGYSIGPSNDMSRQSGRYVLHYPLGDEAPLGSYATEEEALEKALKVIGKDDDGGYQSIRDAMKYESDQMHHCLGNPDQGYCDDVFDGMSRVFSLRDKRGAPHVTIETSGPKSNYMLDDDTIDEVAPGTLDDYLEQRTQRGGYRNLHNYVRNVRPDVYEELTRPEIRQIKGHGDRMPVDRYLPFVQDFVRSQKWANIGDLHHTGLRRAAEAFQPYSMTKARAQGIDLPDYLTEQEIADITAKLQATNKPDGMREGGMAKKEKQSRERIRTDVPWIENTMDFLSGMGATAAANWLPQNVAWGDEDGDRHSYTMPGIVNGVLQMGTLLPGEQPMLEAAESAYLMGKRNANIAAKLDPDNLSKWAERGNVAGDVVGQMPVGGAGLLNKLKFASPVANLMMDAAAAPFDYLGPFIHATPRNYGFAIGGGLALNEALPPAIGGMMSLAEKYGLGSDTPIDADESDRLLASLGFEGAGSRITDAAFARARDASLASDRYATLEAAKEAAHEASQKAAARERMASMVYGSLPGYAKGDLFDIVKNALEANKKAAQADGIGAAEREFLNRDIRAGAQVSERVPTAVQFSGDPHDPALTIGVDVIRENPEQMRKQADVMRKYLNYPRYGSKDPESVFSFMGDHAVENLLALHDMMPPDTRRMSSRWYEGANKIADDAATKYGIPIEGAAGVYASLSPQMDWYKNVSLGNRVMDIAHTQRDTRFTPEMLRKAKQLIAMPNGGFNEATAKIVDLIRDKSYGELNSPAKKAVWLRLYDEAHNPRSFDIVDPMGNVIGPRLTQKGELAAAGWGSLKDIQKAISIFENPEIDNVASMLGNMHKVRSFYNNIVNPWAGKSVTSDTHNVAAALFRPLSGNSLEVKHNLGGASSSDITGAQGTYGLYADAVRRAAAERGIEYPRAMQSITWEGIRGLYDPVAKRNKSLQEQVTGAMKDYRHKRISGDQMREQLLDIGGGMNLPDWNGR